MSGRGFLGSFVERMGNGIMPSVAIPSTRTNGGMITEAVEDLAPQCVGCHGLEMGCGGGFARRYV